MRDSLATHLGNRLVHLMDSAMRHIYVATDGRVGHRQMGWTFLLLTTTGRKTGRARIHTLAYMKNGEDLVIVASNNGGDKHPVWYLNLCATPQVYVQFGRQKGAFLARTASPEERHDLWPKLVAYHPPYEHHQEQTRREIPVVILTPLADRPQS